MGQETQVKMRKFGIVSDTHEVAETIIQQAVEALKKEGVDCIIHCGDIEFRHVDAELWGNLPLICALVDEQHTDSRFVFTPTNWAFTRFNDRVRRLGERSVYVGHRRSFRAISNSVEVFNREIDALSEPHNRLRLIASGHTHNQMFFGRQNSRFINPGALIESIDQCSHEFATFHSITGEASFDRILKKSYAIDPCRVGIIADTNAVSLRNTVFWKKLASEFNQRGVQTIIHLGIIDQEDIGHPELANFTVYFPENSSVQTCPSNWISFSKDMPVVTIASFRFLIQHDFGLELMKSTGYDMEMWFTKQIERFGKIDFALGGVTRIPMLEENLYGIIICPGSALAGQKFVTVELPRNKVTLGNLPFDLTMK